MSLLVNGKAYDWADVDIKLPNLTLEIQEISYDDELEKEPAYGKGQKPRGYGTGNYKPSAKMSLLRDDYDAFIEYCRKQKVTLYKLQIPKIIVAYANEGNRTIQDVINKVSINKVSHKAAQGDKNLKIDLDLIVSGLIVRDGVEPV